MQKHMEALNAPTAAERLDALQFLKTAIESGAIHAPEQGIDVNNHIHTTYSFSPYSPTKAVWMAYQSGLVTAGIMDHDSISGAEEFIQAGEIMSLATTIGVECRADMSGTRLEGRRINNPDQKSIAYMALHGIPHTQIEKVKAFFAPYTEKRNERNRKMVESINALMENAEISLDFDADVAPLSRCNEGGSITERHLLFALAKKMVDRCGKGKAVTNLLKGLGIALSEKQCGQLEDPQNPYYEYDLLGVLKSDMVEKIYIPATEECPPVKEVLALSEEIGAISAYAYLGDVGDSVTGDKKTQKFEDDYLELLFEELHALGFRAVTYMPTRNTLPQLLRLKELCSRYGMLEISGEDINSPRQVFVCAALEKPEFANLIDATWALIGHERAATEDLANGFFSEKSIAEYPVLTDRIQAFAAKVRA